LDWWQRVCGIFQRVGARSVHLRTVPGGRRFDNEIEEDGTMRFMTAVASIAALLALVVAPALAQTQSPTPPPPSSTTRPAPMPEKAKEVEGTVKKVDPATKSVQVSSGLLGIFGATLEVTDETKINVQGKDGSLADIREGAKVKASYESRDGKNVAKSIDVMAADEKDKSAAPARPAAPGAPSSGATPPSATQPSSQPKTQ
jgi:Cu/Ag efflux protein CusF